jgi:hypothetical protein
MDRERRQRKRSLKTERKKIYQSTICNLHKKYTVKPVYNDHPWDSKIVAVVDRWSLFRDSFAL